MSKKSRKNDGKSWTSKDIKQLKQLAKQGYPTSSISVKLGRTLLSVYKKASREGIPISPSNRHTASSGKKRKVRSVRRKKSGRGRRR